MVADVGDLLNYDVFTVRNVSAAAAPSITVYILYILNDIL